MKDNNRYSRHLDISWTLRKILSRTGEWRQIQYFTQRSVSESQKSDETAAHLARLQLAEEKETI